ncbi:B-cell lymphoma 3 protein homolog [Brachionichthys hirsutus]|uniref:B-cell lymphoma 3 protein homolog n=1 Tax=Brachionichthys hirsutus TaxID=412623 RepID=UPI00360520E2
MTMNGDHQSVAAAPLDLRTTHRARWSSAPRTPDSKGRALDARVASPPACPRTHGAEKCCPAARDSQPCSGSGAPRKRPADKSSLRLPFRKRPIPVEPENQRQSPVPTPREERFSNAGDVELSCRESRIGATPETPMRHAETGQSPGGHPVAFLHPFEYGASPVLCFSPAPEQNYPFAHPAENLRVAIALATRQDEDGDTPLHIAVVQGELAVVYNLIHLLLLAHRSLDIYNNLRQTPLHLAVITQQEKMVEALLRVGADPAALDRHGQTAIHLCCEYDQRDCLSVVLSYPSSSTCLESRNYEGLSPVHLAVLRGYKHLSRMLLDTGADINALDIKSGQSPLMHAVESNNADMVHFLIENGCDVNSQSYSGNTALHGACGRGQVETVRLLLKSGADSSLKNYHNDTPVMVAKNKKVADVLRGRSSNPIRAQVQRESNSVKNGSPSPDHSWGCSPSTTPRTLDESAPRSPKAPSPLVFPFC